MRAVDAAVVSRKLAEHFAPEDLARARSAVADIEGPRVQLAAIKLADGSVGTLEQYVMLARIDWRDIIAPAENSRYLAAGIDALHQPGIEDTIARDEADYDDWIDRPGPYAV